MSVVKIVDDEVVKTIINERNSGKSFAEVAKLVDEKFGIHTQANTIQSTYNRELSKLGSNDVAIDAEGTIATLVNERSGKIQVIIKNLDELITYVNLYKVKMINWLDKLDIDLQEYYKNVKDEQDGIMKIRQINDIQDSIMKTKMIMQSDINSYCKMLETYMKMFEAMKPGETKIDKLDMNVVINQHLTSIEKMGYLMINPRSKEFIELLNRAEKDGEVAVLRGSV